MTKRLTGWRRTLATLVEIVRGFWRRGVTWTS